MSEHRYPSQALRGDYIRAGAGMAVCGGLLFAAGLDGIAFYIFTALTVLFAYFGWRTWLRGATVVTVNDEGIASSGLMRAKLAWRDVTQVKLRYFSTRRNRQDGWMQLSLKGNGRAVRLDSHIERFDAVAHRVHEAAVTQRIEFNATTAANFAALDIGQDRGGWGRPSEWTAAEGDGDGPDHTSVREGTGS